MRILALFELGSGLRPSYPDFSVFCFE